MTKEYYERVAIMAKYILNRVNEFNPDVKLSDHLKSALNIGPNPYRPSIDDDGSLLIEFSYGLPSRFYTPLGGFDFCGEGVVKDGRYEVAARIVTEFINQFDLKEVIPANKTGAKNLGPILSVGRDLEGKAFSASCATQMPQGEDVDSEVDFEARNKQWNELRPNLEHIIKAAESVGA